MDIDKHIWKKFKISKHDRPPYTGDRESGRNDLADLFAELGYTYGAEIGVERGRNSLRLLDRIPNLKLILVDPWKGYESRSDEAIEGRYQRAYKRLQDRNVVWMRMASMQAVAQIKDKSLDFVYIDGAHDFDNIIMDLVHWVPKVRKDGTISGHDYFHSVRNGVIRAVDAYTLAHGIRDIYLTREMNEKYQYPSYFWVQK